MLIKEEFVIIDGNALLHRAYHALPPMTTKDGSLVNAVYGFTSILLKIIKELQPDYLAAAFDRKGKTLRAEEFAAYKAQREKKPDELYLQIPMIEEILRAFNIPIIDSDKTGYEADDVIGSIVTEISTNHPEIKSIIVTGDLDALQLVSKNIEVYTLKKGISETMTYDIQAVKARYGLEPGQLIDFKALRGDPSDNIPGVKGVGEKTASQLIQQFGNLEKLYDNLDTAETTDRIKKLLTEQKAEAFLSKRLVTIQCDLSSNFQLAQTRLGNFDLQAVIKIFTKFEFKSLLNKIPKEINGQTQTETEPQSMPEEQSARQSQFLDLSGLKKTDKQNYQLIDSETGFADFLNKLAKQKLFAIDTETTSLNTWQAKLLGLSFCWQENEAYYLSAPQKNQLEQLKPILENDQIKKVGHHLKYDYEILMQNGIYLQGIAFDTLLGAYLLSSGNRNLNLDDLVFSELGYKMQSIEELIGQKGKDQLTMNQVPTEQVSWYACEDADCTFKLYKKLLPQIEKISALGLLEKMELPLIPVLAKMEQNGIKLDVNFLNQLDKKFGQKIKELEKEIYKLAGTEFNIASPLQLKEILFDKLGVDVKGLKKIKTGISTAAGELEKLMDRHPIIPFISQFREYSKLRNTYTKSLAKLADENQRIHTSFNQTIAATGRLSSSNPNLQNIPIRTELGREIRKAFVANEGYLLLSADYSQIELRVIASLADDQKMINSFKKDEDIHRRTAADINKVDINEVTSEQRYAAKEVNFGVIYGLGYVGLAQRTGISRQEAKEFIEEYFFSHPEIRQWLDQTKLQAKENGYVETLLGRRRYLPEINSGVPMIRASAERMAINAPIQGTAADLLKLAMIKIHDELPKISPDSKMLLTVHDELVFEVPEKEIDKVADFVKQTMENIYTLRVPIKVDLNWATNWGEAK